MEMAEYYVCRHCKKTKKALGKNLEKRQQECEMRMNTVVEIDYDGVVSTKIDVALASFRAAHGLKRPGDQGETSGLKDGAVEVAKEQVAEPIGAEEGDDAISVKAEGVEPIGAEEGDEANVVEAEEVEANATGMNKV